MALSNDRTAASLAKTLIAAQQTRNHRDGAIGKPKRYLAGDHDLPFMPNDAKAEYKRVAENARTNWLPLIPDTFSKVLFVDGYRSGGSLSPLWTYWKRNGLMARQNVAHRGALGYGASYGLVLKGSPEPYMRFLHPQRTLVVFEDDEADFPTYGLRFVGTGTDGSSLFRLYDERQEFEIVSAKDSDPQVIDTNDHGMGVTPFVRYRERFGEDSPGLITPLMPIQDRINETVFSLQIALQYAAFRQRWATGLAVPKDEDEYLLDENDEIRTDAEGNPIPNPNHGQPIEPFSAAIDRLWVSPDEHTKFGDFSQTETSGHLNAYMTAVRTLASVAQVSPSLLTGDISNLSAEALAALEAGMIRKAEEYEVSFGESHAQLFRLAAHAAGDYEAAADFDAEIIWRDREARSLAQVVDALGKMVQMLQVPPEALWKKIPGTTSQEVEDWKAAKAASPSALDAIASTLARQDSATVTEDEEAAA